MRRFTCWTIGLILNIFQIAFVSAGASTNPNILFVIADDLGWADPGFMGSEIDTPTIDSLAVKGLRLTGSYVQPVCSPTRTSILTGRYPIRYGLLHHVYANGDPFGLYVNETLLPQKLKALGYATYCVGKWHLGFTHPANTPTARGFDSFYGYYSGSQDYYTHKSGKGYDLRNNTDPVKSKNEVYSTYTFSEEAERMVRHHAATQPQQPMFMWLAWQSVHDPIEVPSLYVQPYKDHKDWDENRKQFAGMLSCMDEGLGNVTQALRDVGMWDNTNVIFLADNGAPIGPTFALNGGCNYPLRGSKHTLWEGGTRSNSFLYGPLVHHRAGQVEPGMLHAVDWFQTVLHIAGGSKSSSSSRDGFPLDSLDVYDVITAGTPSPRQEFLINYDPLASSGDQGCCGYAGLRSGKWKLLIDPGDPSGIYHCNNFSTIVVEEKEKSSQRIVFQGTARQVMLFDVENDPQEAHDVAAANQDVVKQLQGVLQTYIDAAMPDGHQPTDPLSDPAKQPGENKGFWTPWLPDP